MAQYKKGMDTKHTILTISKKLFYENGYIKTSCKKICEEAEVNLGLIHYHFKTKKNIATIIYTYFLIEVKDLVKNIMTNELNNYELKYAIAVENWIYMSLLLKNESYKKFYYEICKESLLLDENTKIIEFFFKLHNNTYNLNLTPNEIKLIRVVNATSGMGLVEKYIEGYFDMTLEELIEYKIRNMFRLMNLSKDNIDEIIQNSYEIYKKMNIGISDYFKVYEIK